MISLLIFLSSVHLLNGVTLTCDDRQSDIFIILNSSGPISNDNFNVARATILRSVQAITISHELIKVPKENSTLTFNLDSFNKKLPTEKVLPRRLVLRSDDGTNLEYIRPQEDTFVEVVLVGIGYSINHAIIQLLASEKANIPVITYQELVQEMKEVLKQACYLPDPMPLLQCKSTQLDLVFLVDLSGSLSANDFENSKKFVKSFIKGLKLTPNDTRVAMLSFSQSVRLDFNLDTYSKEDEYLAAIDRVERFGSATAIGKALQMALANVWPKRRQAVPFNVVLVTDGMNNLFPKSTIPATELKNNGANIITVAVGTDVDMEELNAVASNGKAIENLDYEALTNNVKKIQQTIVCG